jgi:hypothetical protein
MEKITDNLLIFIAKTDFYMLNLKDNTNSIFIELCDEDIKVTTNIINSIKDETYNDVLDSIKQSLTKSIIVKENTLTLQTTN